MSALDDWPPAPALQTERLSLEPLRVDHAEEMAPLLDDPRLHAFTGGSPRTLEELRSRYEEVIGWSVDERKRWCNWIVRERSSGQAVGGIQATITVDDDAFVGELAWIVGSRHQRQGYAREAALAMVAWLRAQGALVLIADIHPENEASMTIARALGLAPSGELGEGGDTRWTG